MSYQAMWYRGGHQQAVQRGPFEAAHDRPFHGPKMQSNFQPMPHHSAAAWQTQPEAMHLDALDRSMRYREEAVASREEAVRAREDLVAERLMELGDRERRSVAWERALSRRENLVESREANVAREQSKKENGAKRLAKGLMTAGSKITGLEKERDGLLREKELWRSERASFGAERSRWALEKKELERERDAWKARESQIAGWRLKQRLLPQ